MAATTSEIFNQNSNPPHKHGGHGSWMFLHGALMLGMVMGGVALAAPAGAATIGDFAVQSLYMMKDMAVGLVNNADVLMDMATNAWDGNLAPNTWDAVSMHGGAAMHSASAAAHVTGTITPCDQWLSALSPDELAGIQGDLQSTYGGMSLCQYHDMNIMHHGVK